MKPVVSPGVRVRLTAGPDSQVNCSGAAAVPEASVAPTVDVPGRLELNRRVARPPVVRTT